jgi:uncharacterized protein (TIGR03118 family)
MKCRVIGIWLAGSLLMTAPLVHAAQGAYRSVDLVSDLDGRAPVTDANLVNPWGITLTPNGTLRVANNGTATSGAFGVRGRRFGQLFSVPTAVDWGPTGIVFNGAKHAFLIHDGSRSAPALYITCGLDGSLSGWNPAVDADHAIRMSLDEEAVYTGLALARSGGSPLLYVANFVGGKIEVYDSNFEEVELDGDFSDSGLPGEYSPFNVQNVGGRLFVMYAKLGPGGDEERGLGFGYVNVFDTAGHLLQRFASNGSLNAPWGVALAPRSFGRFGGAVLVGNFGDGTIHAYDRTSGAWLGVLEDASGHALEIEGLWGIAFNGESRHDGDQDNDGDDDGDDGNRGDDDAQGTAARQAGEDASSPGDSRPHGLGGPDIGANGRESNDDGHGEHDRRHRDRDAAVRLYFAAGIEDEAHGLFGYIRATHAHDDEISSRITGTVGAGAPGAFITLAANPVRPSAGEAVQFRLGVTTGDAIELGIYDASGRQVAMLRRPAGESELRWNGTASNGSRLQSGIYLYRVRSGSYATQGKLVLLP